MLRKRLNRSETFPRSLLIEFVCPIPQGSRVTRPSRFATVPSIGDGNDRQLWRARRIFWTGSENRQFRECANTIDFSLRRCARERRGSRSRVSIATREVRGGRNLGPGVLWPERRIPGGFIQSRGSVRLRGSGVYAGRRDRHGWPGETGSARQRRVRGGFVHGLVGSQAHLRRL